MRTETLRHIDAGKIIAIIRGVPARQIAALSEALASGGIRLIEVTFDQQNPETWKETARAIECIAAGPQGSVLAGAGTVMSAEQLRMAADAGARYIISPNADESVIDETRKMGLVSIPGCLTPTEIAAAHQAGADYVKVFPAGMLGADYIKAVKAPLSHVKLLAVGGVNERNIADFLRAGCVGAGVGGNLVNREWIAAGAFEKIASLAREYVRATAQQCP